LILKSNYLDLEFNLNIIIFCLLISLISQLGDLFISFLKRKAKIKDTGKILPGHGGIIDRVDGIIFAVPFSYFLLKLI
jgi:phosphatidate cytidylyltransferase